MVVNGVVNAPDIDRAMVYATTMSNSSRGGDFLANLERLFKEPDRILGEMADPDIQMITLGNMGIFDKESAGFQLGSAVYLNRIGTAVDSFLSYQKIQQDMEKQLGQMF